MPTASTPPERITAGDTVSFTWSHTDYPATDGWTVAFRLVGTSIALSLSATASGDAYTVAATATATAALTVAAAGVACTLMGTATLSAQRFEVFRAPCLLLPNPATITGDVRGHAARTYAAIIALLEGRATKDQMSYCIGDRELSRIPIPELLALKDYYGRAKRAEESAARIASGLPGRPRMVVTRMVRA
jgi:hypothetical protein